MAAAVWTMAVEKYMCTCCWIEGGWPRRWCTPWRRQHRQSGRWCWLTQRVRMAVSGGTWVEVARSNGEDHLSGARWHVGQDLSQIWYWRERRPWGGTPIDLAAACTSSSPTRRFGWDEVGLLAWCTMASCMEERNSRPGIKWAEFGKARPGRHAHVPDWAITPILQWVPRTKSPVLIFVLKSCDAAPLHAKLTRVIGVRINMFFRSRSQVAIGSSSSCWTGDRAYVSQNMHITWELAVVLTSWAFFSSLLFDNLPS